MVGQFMAEAGGCCMTLSNMSFINELRMDMALRRRPCRVHLLEDLVEVDLVMLDALLVLLLPPVLLGDDLLGWSLLRHDGLGLLWVPCV
jgi:hypothetical protein